MTNNYTVHATNGLGFLMTAPLSVIADVFKLNGAAVERIKNNAELVERSTEIFFNTGFRPAFVGDSKSVLIELAQ